MNKSEFLAQADELSSESAEYLEAVYDWAVDYALPMDDAEYILEAVADKYAGEYSSDAEFAESFYEDAYSDRLAAIRELAQQDPIIEITFNWEQTARLGMNNAQGFDWAAFNGHYFWAAD